MREAETQAAAGDGAAPVLETARLLLRKPRPGDFPRLWSYLTDPLAKRFTGGVTRLSYDERFALFLTECEAPFTPDAAEFAVIEKNSGRYIGYCGFRREAGHAGPEALYGFCRDTWGRGCAAEALRAALTWYFRAYPVDSCRAAVEPGNAASARVLEKAGFRYMGTDAQGRAEYSFMREGPE